jgi:hypothetical protein
VRLEWPLVTQVLGLGQIAAEAPSSRQNMSVTINNAATGNPTQITVYAAGNGSAIHDIAPGIGGYIESAFSTILNIAAVVFPETGLPFLAAAVDAAEAGQAFSNGEDVQGILNLAQAVGMGANGFGYTQTAQIISAASQGAGGVYGIVQSAETGNAAGIICTRRLLSTGRKSPSNWPRSAKPAGAIAPGGGVRTPPAIRAAVNHYFTASISQTPAPSMSTTFRPVPQAREHCLTLSCKLTAA